MSLSIGLLLPRSTDYPSLGFEILDGLKAYLHHTGISDYQLFTENIGFGEEPQINYSKAEKLLTQDNVQLIIAWCSTANAEQLYPLAEAVKRPFIFIDAGMQLPAIAPNDHCYHITLQGVHACRLAGQQAGAGNRKVLMATSFYDGGYRGPWGYARGLEEAGGSVCGNFVSDYKEAGFTIDPYLALLQHSGAQSVAACFSSYLAGLFMRELKAKYPSGTHLPLYCSPFMAEEQLLARCDFPGGDLKAIIPWSLKLINPAQTTFLQTVQEGKQQTATLFHLIGWEAGIVAAANAGKPATTLKGFSYESPRGQVTISTDTHYSYTDLYAATIVENEQGKCSLQIDEIIPVTADQHQQVMNDRPEQATGWRNNYLCI